MDLLQEVERTLKASDEVLERSDRSGAKKSSKDSRRGKHSSKESRRGDHSSKGEGVSDKHSKDRVRDRDRERDRERDGDRDRRHKHSKNPTVSKVDANTVRVVAQIKKKNAQYVDLAHSYLSGNIYEPNSDVI
jgi:hypothetical protein